MTYPRKGSTSKGKKKLLQVKKPDLIAADPTSVFFSALQRSHPAALAALANYCTRQPEDPSDGLVGPSPDDEDELSGIEKPSDPSVQIQEKSVIQAYSDGLNERKDEPSVEGGIETVSDNEVTHSKESMIEDPAGDTNSAREAEIDVKAELEVKTEPDAEAEPEAEGEPKTEREPKAEASEPEHNEDLEPSPESDPKVSIGEIEPDIGAVPEPEHKSASKPYAEPEQKIESKVELETESETELGTELEPELEPQLGPDLEPDLDPELASPPEVESGTEINAEDVPNDEGDTALETNVENEPSDEKSEDDPTSLAAKPSKSTKEPLRIAAAPKVTPTKKGSPLLSGGGVDAIPNAHDKSIQDEFKGVYEKATQRGGVFDAKNRDAFSSESEKKVRSSYLGLKAISFDEALTAQIEKDPALMRAQLQPASVMEPPPTIAEKAKAVFSVVDMMHKTPVIIATALVCLSFLGFFVGNLYRAEGHLEEGESFFLLRKYPESIKSLSEAISLNPMRARSYFMRGRAYNKIGETGKAVNDFSTSLQMNSNSVEALDHRASIFMRGGRYDKALADYRSILKLQPDKKDVYVFNNAASAARQVGKFEEALQFCEKALSIDSNDKNALIGKALCEISLLQYGKAIEICNEIIQKDPQFLEAYVTRGWCSMLLKRDSAAMHDFDFVLARMPLNARASLNRGHLFYKTGRLDEALRDYSTAVSGDPAFTEARAARAWAVLNSNPRLALEDLKAVTASQQYGNSVKYWTLRAQLEYQLGKYPNASQAYRRTIKLAKQSEPTALPTLYARLGSAFTAMRQYDKAVEACDEALKLDPKNSLALSIRGFAHESGGNRISALADFSNALTISPRMPEALLYRAQHYVKSKEFHSAQRDLNDYLSVRANDQAAKKLLAAVSRKTEHTSSIAEIGTTKRRKYMSVPFAQLLSGGISELNKGNTETAADMLTEAVRQNPSDATARRYLCHALVREDPKAAVVQFDALRSAGPLPPDDERSYRHALSLAATGSLVEASSIDKALRVVEVEPGNAQACYKLSTVYAAAGMLSKAAHYCQSGLSHARNSAETKRFQDLYQQLNKQNIQGEQKEDIEG